MSVSNVENTRNCSENEYYAAREYMVVKHNDLIQNSRMTLDSIEQKIILYLVSKLKPDDIEFRELVFDMKEFLWFMGKNLKSGGNYNDIKDAMKSLRDRSIWLHQSDGSVTTLAWLDKITIFKNSGKIQVKFDDALKPFLLQLNSNFTKYMLLFTLAMKSKYSMRIYELLKSHEYQTRWTFDLDEFKQQLSCEHYTQISDFKRNVLRKAVEEINDLSDIVIKYTLVKKGNKYTQIEFFIYPKNDTTERFATYARIDSILNPTQISLFDH